MSESTSITDSIKQLADAYNHFAFDLLYELIKQHPDENLVVSPLSVATALSILAAGAEGETRQEIAETLYLNPGKAAEIDLAAAELAQLVRNQASIHQMLIEREQKEDKILAGVERNLREEAKSAATVELASSLWGAPDVAFGDKFRQICEDGYNAAIRSMGLSPLNAASAINRWVEEATHGKITEIVTSIDATTILTLLTTVYLKAKWDFRFFDPRETQKLSFHLPDGRQKAHPIMHHLHCYPYREDTQCQVVRLGFEGRRLGMWICLPTAGLPLSELPKVLTTDTLRQWTSELARRWGTVGLPRFKASSTAYLAETLSDLGMRRAFDPIRAQFAGITSQRGTTFLNDILHAAVVEVNEAGVEAAGVSIVLFAGGAGPHDPFEMIIDRPFFWAIDDETTGAILFTGIVVDPEDTPAANIDYDQEAEFKKRWGDAE